MTVLPLWKDGKDRCLTFSYDDGVTQDFRLVEIFNKYNLKCTFNLNSGKFGINQPANGNFLHPVTHNKIQASEVAELYKGHEVAVHTVTHPRLQYESVDTIEYEVLEDRRALESIVGYPITGMAYPFGTWNDTVLDVLKKCGIKYARTVEATKTFAIPQDFLTWHPTCHFEEEGMDELVNKFLNIGQMYEPSSYLRLFYVWGHSYEFDGHETWELFESFCEKLAGHDNIWYATNGEIVSYYEGLQAATFSADKNIVTNNCGQKLWYQVGDKVVSVEPGETKRLF